MGMIIKVYVEYDNQEVNITTLNSDNSKTSTVTITSKFIEEYLQTIGTKDYEESSNEKTEISEKGHQNVANDEIEENAFSPMSETDLSQYTVLDSTCDDDEPNGRLGGLLSPDSSQIKKIENASNHIPFNNNIDSTQNDDILTASSIFNDENNDATDRPKEIISTHYETSSIGTGNKIVDVVKMTTTDVEEDMNALQSMSYNVDDFLTSVPGETQPGEITTLRAVGENLIEKYDDDDIAVADMSRDDIVKDYDPHLKEYFVVDEILASRFNEETQSTEYLLKPRKCVPRDDMWRPLSNLEKPNRLSIIEPNRLYIQYHKPHRSNKKLIVEKKSNEKSSHTDNRNFKVPNSPEALSTSEVHLKKHSKEKFPTRPIRPRMKKTLPVPIAASAKAETPSPPSPKTAGSNSPQSPIREPPSKRTKLSETQNTFTNWLQCSICQSQCLSLAGLLAHEKTHSQKRGVVIKRKMKTESLNVTDCIQKQPSEQIFSKNTTPVVANHKLSHTLPVHIPLDRIEDMKSLLLNTVKVERRNGVKVENENQLSCGRAKSRPVKKQLSRQRGNKNEKSKSRKLTTVAERGQKTLINREFIESDSDSDSEKMADKYSKMTTPSRTKQENHKLDNSESIRMSTLSTDSNFEAHASYVRPQTARRTKKFGQKRKNSEIIDQNMIERSPEARRSKSPIENPDSETVCSRKLSSCSIQLQDAKTESTAGNEIGKYACPYCLFTTNEKHQLNTHEYAHKGGETHPCDLCNRTFVTSTGLWHHKTQYHQNQPLNNGNPIRARLNKYPIVLVKKYLS